jgi:DNA-binding MarR family transcriptional regulator
MGEIQELQRLVHLIGTYLDATVGTFAVSQAEAHVLASLERSGTMAIAALHRELALKRSTLTNILDRLESRGLIRRETNPGDRRSFLVYLTPKGRRVAKRVVMAFDGLEEKLHSTTSSACRAGFIEAVQALESVIASELRERRQADRG